MNSEGTSLPQPQAQQKSRQVPARPESWPGKGGDKCQSRGLAQGKKRDTAAVGGGRKGRVSLL